MLRTTEIKRITKDLKLVGKDIIVNGIGGSSKIDRAKS